MTKSRSELTYSHVGVLTIFTIPLCRGPVGAGAPWDDAETDAMSKGWRQNAAKGWPGKGVGALKSVTVLLKAKRKRLNTDQHTRYTGNTQHHVDARAKTTSGSGLQNEWRAERAPRWIQRSPSGSRAATRQHTINPRTPPVVPSSVSVVF